jgi:hypothetical protein
MWLDELLPVRVTAHFFYVSSHHKKNKAMDDNKENKMSLNLDPQIAGGSYANLAIISHSRSEFVIDFASSLPGLPGPKINNRIVMSPEHTKRLLNALAENVGKYEAQFGTIMLEGAAKGSTFNLADMVPNGGAKS